MVDISSFPSVFESTRAQLNGVSNTLLDGLKIEYQEESYMVGNLALKEGLSPHRLINCAPGELDFEVMLRAALLVAQSKAGSNFSFTMGFPFEMFQLHKDSAKQKLTRSYDISYDSSTFKRGDGMGRQVVTVNVDNVYVIPEVAGGIIALRHGPVAEKNNFFILSLGYGSMEGVLSTPNGIIRRTATSARGLRYAINMMKEELQKNHYLGFKTEHQLNNAFQNGRININKRMVDLTALRQRVLKSYYENIVRPAVANAFEDSDFEDCSKMYIVGGGAYFNELTSQISSQFEGILNVQITDEPEKMAVNGYCINTSRQIDQGVPIGIDMGNANTLVCAMNQQP
ncbi:MAG: ParM/StbA family protein [Balneolaceae bacterium]|nr:ParM/StbA family protein [Balneolaceae bacterium]